jgi:protein TonB
VGSFAPTRLDCRLAPAFALAVLAGAAFAADESNTSAPAAGGEPFRVEVFKGPVALKTPIPRYPDSERLVGNEGWVHLNLMVDAHGKPFEVSVVDSSGNPVFDKTAIAAVEKWTFEPARMGTQPIEGSTDFKMLFSVNTPAVGAGKSFIKAYRSLGAAIEAGDKAAADEQLAALQAQNLYEDAYKGVASYHYHYKWGTETQQLQDLRRALAYESKPYYLPKRDFIALMDRMLALQVKAHDFASALDTWDLLRKVDPRESEKNWRGTIDKIQALKQNHSPFHMDGRMEGTAWFGHLLRKRFQIVVTNGELSEIKLRCKDKYLFFRYQPGLEYTLENWPDNCRMQLVGSPGTTFDLIQS